MPSTLAPVFGGPRSGTYRDDIATLVRVRGALRREIGVGAHTSDLPLVEAIFDDLELVLGEHSALSAALIEDLTPRLHSTFRRLLTIAAQVRPCSGAGVAELPLPLAAEAAPRKPESALGYLRRLALAVESLLDRLADGCVAPTSPMDGQHRSSTWPTSPG